MKLSLLITLLTTMLKQNQGQRQHQPRQQYQRQRQGQCHDWQQCQRQRQRQCQRQRQGQCHDRQQCQRQRQVQYNVMIGSNVNDNGKDNVIIINNNVNDIFMRRMSRNCFVKQSTKFLNFKFQVECTLRAY